MGKWFWVVGARTLVAMLIVTAMVQAGRASDIQACPISIDDAVTLEREQIEHLFNRRGIDYDLTRVLSEDLQGSVERHLSHRQSKVDHRARGLLFYIGNAEALCVMFWRIGETPGERLFVIEKLPVDPARLVPSIDELVASMQHETSGVLRQAKPRNPNVTLSRSAAPMTPSGNHNAPEALAELSKMLLPETIAKHMGDLASLTIIPCLNIGIAPFSAFDPDGDGRMLVETTVINVESELRHVYDDRAFAWGGSIDAPLVLGNPDASMDADWDFPTLPGAEREARAIATRLNVNAIVGAAASTESVVRSAVDADYLHIAAHGLSSIDDPLDGSFLALTGSRLTARQIQGLKLTQSPLVVLSACQTGLGAPLDAGVIGLARGFILAGASATVATLWNVDDAATEALMVRFVDNLETMSPGEALRAAQQATRQRYPHPRYWSGFMLFGSRIVSTRN